jgi:hypothetical protein
LALRLFEKENGLTHEPDKFTFHGITGGAHSFSKGDTYALEVYPTEV